MSSLPRPASRGGSQPLRDLGATFSLLDANVPLLLLPVRLETRFDITADNPDAVAGAAGTARRDLLVRVYPDDVHRDTHLRGLTRQEIEFGQRFWKAAWLPTSTRDAQEQAFATLASRLGAFRAAWVLEATRPLNWDRYGTAAQGPGPRFGEPPLRNHLEPGTARLLPDHWLVTGYQNEDVIFTQPGSPIRRDLTVSPDLAALGKAPTGASDLFAAQGLAWMRDFDAAKSAGMAVRIPLARKISLKQPIDVFVCGVRTGTEPAALGRELADLLAAHHWTHGVDFVRRGTPTNNSDRAMSNVSLSEPDTGALLDSILRQSDPRMSATAPLFRRRFDAAATAALGLEPGSILERVAFRDDAQLDLSGAMSAALWPATWGHFLRSMVAGALTPDGITWARRHFIANVRGGGLLPAIRLGSQPYAVHPVALETRHDQPADNLDRFENVLLDLLPAWDDAVTSRVARLDIDAADRPGDPESGALGDATATLARILGATPNPSDLTVTPVTNELGMYEVQWGLYLFLLDVATSPDFPTIAAKLGTDLAAARTLEAQINVLERVIDSGDASSPYPMGPLWSEAHSSGNDAATSTAAQKAIDFINGYVLPLLNNHLTRTKPLLDLGPSRTAVTGVMPDRTDPPLFFSLFADTAERVAWTGPLVARRADGADSVRAWLAALALEVRDPTQPAAAPGSHPPLLFQILKRAIAVVNDEDRPDLIAGLDMLSLAATDGRLADPVTDLETLMGEVLGTCTHRIDAWLSGSAADRLAAARRDRPRGVNIGGFGWVLGLRQAGALEPSQGFIHAPSPDHAATAAILRSGWSALGDGALGVDISSARVRAASWIVDGVRDGHRLSELLGQALERRLHDARLDRWIEHIRIAVLAGTGHASDPPISIVDGFLVARAWSGGTDIAPLTAEESAVLAKLKATLRNAGSDTAPLTTRLNLHAADLDAVADAGLFASVHAIVRGNPDRASATLAATGSAMSAPPPLSALTTARGGQRITHRILMLFDPLTAVNDPASPDAIAEPVLEAWTAGTLRLDRIAYGVWVEENGTKTWQGPFSLASLGLGALELLTDLPSGATIARGTTLERRLGWPLVRAAAGNGRTIAVTIDAELSGGAGGADTVPLSVALAGAHSVQALLHGGRPAHDTDLATTTVTSTADAGGVASRESTLIEQARGVAGRLRTALDGAAPTAAVLDACAALSTWHVPGAIPRAGLADLSTAGDDADRTALLVEAESLHRRMQARIDARDAVQGSDLAAALARVHALLPGALVLPPFTPVDVEALRRIAARSETRLGAPEQAVPWLHQIGRVREHVSTAAVAIDLVEAMAGATRFRPTVIQIPDYPEERWAATSLPTHDRSLRTCMLSLTPMPSAATFAGLAIDAWTEVIPDLTTTTGIAVHFDSPSARAPQAWLLATPPRARAWTYDEVLAVVRQTMKRARHRAVGPADIQGFGQYLPAIYLADATDPGARSARGQTP